MHHDDVEEATVVAFCGERWQERPLACGLRTDEATLGVAGFELIVGAPLAS